MKRPNFKNVEEPARTFFLKVVASFPETSYQSVVGMVDGRECPILRIPSPSGASNRNLDFYSTDAIGDILEFGGWHVHVEDLHASSSAAAFESLRAIVVGIMSKTKGLWIRHLSDGPHYTLIDLPADVPYGDEIIVWK